MNAKAAGLHCVHSQKKKKKVQKTKTKLLRGTTGIACVKMGDNSSL